MQQIFLLLGSNLGDRLAYLNQAKALIEQFAGEIVQQSKIYQTQAWGKTDQPDFYNQALEIDCDLDPEELILTTQQLEEKMGRERNARWDARIIDIDILYYAQQIYQSNILQIPHPEIPNRRFTLLPLCDIAPDFIHPELGVNQQILLNRCQDSLEAHPIS